MNQCNVRKHLIHLNLSYTYAPRSIGDLSSIIKKYSDATATFTTHNYFIFLMIKISITSVKADFEDEFE